jgi:aspartyl-tRNA(Asn)/glutamyl-tRNA(Gln) amidotransferase subunit C
MPDRISRADVEHVANLARLMLSTGEIEQLTDQLGVILDHAEDVAALDLEGVEPTAHPLDLVNVWAEDEPRPCLSVDEALANAPDREGDSFRVPAA